MSYDLMVFEPAMVPAGHGHFMRWYNTFTQWSEGHGYNDASIASPKLQAWLTEIQRTYPDMNSLESADLDPDDGSLSDYSIGKEAVYVGFAWPKAEQAYRKVYELAAEHGIGFFDVSSGGEEVWLPQGRSLKLAHQKKPPTFLQKLKQLVSR